MKKKVLTYVVPVLTAFIIFGFAIGSDFFTSDLSQSPDFIPGTPITPSLVGDSCSGTGQERHDDQSFENGGGWNATVTDGKIMTLFRPSSYPWKYNKFCIAMTRTAAATNDSLVFDIMIYDTTGAATTPGVAKDSVMGLSARNIPIYPLYAWYSYDISSKPSTLVTSGSIYIGYRYNASNQVSRFSMIDQSIATPLWPAYYNANYAATWTIATTAWASYRAFGMRTMGQTPPAPSANTLVIINDSTATTAQRTADRDTLRRYVNMLVGGNVTWLAKNTTTVFPDLSSYSTIIFQETSFDAVAVRSLVATQRQALKDWLASGTPTNKKSLIMIGGDLGYAYDQTGVAQLDTVFSRSYGGFQFVLDNGAPAANAFVGQVPGTFYDAMSTAPPGGSYWPDGCRPISGGTAFNLYKFKTDTIAGVSKTGAGWNVISTFQDPRYFTGAGDGSGDIGFKRVLKNMIAWVRLNNGVITSVTPITSIVAEKYNLSQNYPNPFNPTTKINFSIPVNGFVSLKVYNITGQEVMTLVNENMTQGVYSIDFNGSRLSSGTYFYRIEAGNFVETKKMLLVK